MDNTLGLRHVAINVKNAQISKDFYMRVLKMDLEWEPDAGNVYLTSQGQDNLAIHQVDTQDPLGSTTHQSLDHLGFALPSLESVDEWYHWVVSQNCKIARPVRTHRDGAKSFYFLDPDQIVIQMIFHPPLIKRVL